MFFGNHVAHFYSVHFKIMESMEKKDCYHLSRITIAVQNSENESRKQPGTCVLLYLIEI